MAETNQIRGLGISWRAEVATTAEALVIPRGDVTFQTASFIWVGNGNGRVEPMDFNETAAVNPLIDTRETDDFSMTTDSAGVEQYILDVADNKADLSGLTAGDFATLFSEKHDQNTDTGTTQTSFIFNEGHATKEVTFDASNLIENFVLDLNAIQMIGSTLPLQDTHTLTPPFGSTAFVFLDTDADNPGMSFYDPACDNIFNALTGKETV